jgi:hypothetical protein
LGERELKEELLAQMHESRKDHHGAELGDADVPHAEGFVAREMCRLGWTEADLAERRKGDPKKVRIAWCLRQESTMTLKWIAQRLKMGKWTTVSNCLVQKRKEDEKCH